jgi:outer membrane protein OmpA-like peptidoglycan-associated protein
VASASPNPRPDADCTTIESRVARVAGKSQVRFSYGASNLTKKARTAIASAASILRACPQLSVLINGYADRSGTAKDNKLISKDRAQAVHKRLRSLGVRNSMTVKGLGDHHPIAKNSTAKGRAANRRVVILIP